MNLQYQKLAKYYDKINHWKDYEGEIKFLEKFFDEYNLNIKEILDVACGTGTHAVLLRKKGYVVTGIDLNSSMLSIAKKKTKKVVFRKTNMKNFNLNKNFDAVICMFSSMNFNLNTEEFKKTLRNFYVHLKPNRICIFDIWLLKETFKNNSRHIDEYIDKDCWITRYMHSIRFGNRVKITTEYLIKDEGKISFHENIQNLGLFSTMTILRLMKDVGFSSKHSYKSAKKNCRKNNKKLVPQFFIGIKK